VKVLEVSYTDSFDRLSAADWRSLAERAGHVFATREWLLTWWRHYGKGRPLIGFARREGEPAAIVPLYVWWRHGLPVLRFAGHGPGDQLGPVCAPLTDPDAAAVVAAAIEAIPLRRFVLLAEHIAGDQGFGALTGARPLYRESSPVLRLEGGATWEEFLQERGRNFRQQARRFPRKLGELGAVSYRLASDPARLQGDMDTLFWLHRERWGRTDTPFLQAAAFHREFAAQALREGWLRLWFLEIDGRPVAALYGFRFAGAESAYQAGRNPALGNQPVGFVLLAHAVREALADGMREYRLLRGGAAYKERFATSDPGLETYGLPRGASARTLLGAALAARGRSLGLRRILDRL
jgi:CelD/BcsL family acetyltransferase involved in cellulose biosynthesis